MHISTIIQSVGTKILDAVFPIHCVGCGTFCLSDDLPYLCLSCRNAIKLRQSFECIGCKIQVPQGQTCFLCRPDWHVDRLFIATDYAHPPIAKLIQILKYGFAQGAAYTLGSILRKYIGTPSMQKVNIFSGNFLLLPVPSSRQRYRWRGFNQAELITRECFTSLYMSIDANILKKTKNSAFQSKVQNRADRFLAIKGIFGVVNSDKVLGANIILIDDVCTTGATLNACAEILKKSGASSVSALVLARGSDTTAKF